MIVVGADSTPTAPLEVSCRRAAGPIPGAQAERCRDVLSLSQGVALACPQCQQGPR
jgi:hypothetical protein